MDESIQPGPPGTFYVRGDSGRYQCWHVGERYTLHKVLGEGSFSAVCLATDHVTGESVALKQVANVLGSVENAKRVLREAAILRRLRHPNIVKLHDVFLRPSDTGRFVYRGGKLVPTSVDLYMALEYCNQGDLFHMRGQLSEGEVKAIMWQLLHTLRYMHGCHVLHRDIKSANVLIALEGGRRIAKLCDFGSARSATTEGPVHGSGGPGRQTSMCPMSGHSSEARLLGGSQSGTAGEIGPLSPGPPLSLHGPAAYGPGSNGANGGPYMLLSTSLSPSPARPLAPLHAALHHSLSQPLASQPPQTVTASLTGLPPLSSHIQAEAAQQLPKDPRLTPSVMRDGGAHSATPVPSRPHGFAQPMTRAVCTPCYRAPEVVMSHGVYSSALDMWSLGCVYGELLQRVPYLGKAATPHLQVAPVIAVTGTVVTPREGETFDGPTNPVTRQELAALFAVTGTPPWSTVDSVVRHPGWRAYMQRLPGRAPQLYRRFAAAGAAAVDLLSRLLEFDPGRRASAEEALSHEYFDELRLSIHNHQGDNQGRYGGLYGGLLLSGETSEGLVAVAGGASWLLGQEGSSGQSDGETGGEEEEVVTDSYWDDRPDQGSASPYDLTPARPSSPSNHPNHVNHHRQLTSGLGQLAGTVSAPAQHASTLPGHASTLGPHARQASGSCHQPMDLDTPGGAHTQGGVNHGMNPGVNQGVNPGVNSAVNQGLNQGGPEASGCGGGRSAAAPPAVTHAPTATATKGTSTAAAAAAAGSTVGVGAAGMSPGTAGLVRTASDCVAVQAVRGAAVCQTGQAGVGAAAGQLLTPFYEIGDPSAALAALEAELAGVVSGADARSIDRLREMLERECEEHASAAATLLRQQLEEGAMMAEAPRSGGHRAHHQRHHRRHRTGLKPDPGINEDPSAIAAARMPHHRDSEQAGLEPEAHLRAGRHGEWAQQSLADRRLGRVARGAAAAPTWGVSLVPPGQEESMMTPGMMDAVRAQHAR